MSAAQLDSLFANIINVFGEMAVRSFGAILGLMTVLSLTSLNAFAESKCKLGNTFNEMIKGRDVFGDDSYSRPSQVEDVTIGQVLSLMNVSSLEEAFAKAPGGKIYTLSFSDRQLPADGYVILYVQDDGHSFDKISGAVFDVDATKAIARIKSNEVVECDNGDL